MKQEAVEVVLPKLVVFQRDPYSASKQHIWARYTEVILATLTCQIILGSVNRPSRLHYLESKQPRHCTTWKHKYA